VFRDRQEAGQKLAWRLMPYKKEGSLVLALPRGGVVVGYEVASLLETDLDIVVTRKLGAPGEPELAIGAVVDGHEVQSVLNDDLILALGVGSSYLHEEIVRQLSEIHRRQAKYRGARPPEEIQGRTVFLIDDGIATGASVRAAVKAIRQGRPERLVLAVPVACPETILSLRSEVDDLICLEEPEPFISVGTHYLNFDQTTDEEVMALLESACGKK
jgi:putative phosphoribosyl transferase